MLKDFHVIPVIVKLPDTGGGWGTFALLDIFILTNISFQIGKLPNPPPSRETNQKENTIYCDQTCRLCVIQMIMTHQRMVVYLRKIPLVVYLAVSCTVEELCTLYHSSLF